MSSIDQIYLDYASCYSDILTELEQDYRSRKNVPLTLRLFDLHWENIRRGQNWAAGCFHENQVESVARLCIMYPLNAPHILDLRLPPRDAIVWMQTMLEAARFMKNPFAEASALMKLGIAHKNLGSRKDAYRSQKDALKIARKLQNQSLESDILGNLGIIYDNRGKPKISVRLYERQLEIARAKNDQDAIIRALVNIGFAYVDVPELTLALDYGNQVLGLALSQGDRRHEGKAHNVLGSAYSAQHDFEKAIGHHKQHIFISHEVGDSGSEAYGLYNLGDDLMSLDLPRRAELHLMKAVQLLEDLGDANLQTARQLLEKCRAAISRRDIT